MNEWQIVVLLCGILTFFVGTLIPIVKPLIKLNGVMQKNTDAINALTEKMDCLTLSNKEDHNHFNSAINELKIDVSVLKAEYRKDK